MAHLKVYEQAEREDQSNHLAANLVNRNGACHQNVQNRPIEMNPSLPYQDNCAPYNMSPFGHATHQSPISPPLNSTYQNRYNDCASFENRHPPMNPVGADESVTL